MGGNALKEYGNVRLADAHYQEVKMEVLKKLVAIGVYCAVPKSIGQKESHGDLDILISKKR